MVTKEDLARQESEAKSLEFEFSGKVEMTPDHELILNTIKLYNGIDEKNGVKVETLLKELYGQTSGKSYDDDFEDDEENIQYNETLNAVLKDLTKKGDILFIEPEVVQFLGKQEDIDALKEEREALKLQLNGTEEKPKDKEEKKEKKEEKKAKESKKKKPSKEKEEPKEKPKEEEQEQEQEEEKTEEGKEEIHWDDW